MSRSASTRRLFLASLLAVAWAALAPASAAEFKSERITVSTEGKGSDVILIPGLGSSPRVWRELVRAVPGYRYHLVQVSGFAGHARGQNAEGTVAAPVAEEIARYIAAQGLDRPAIIGHSMGGTIGLMLAGRHPNALSRLMVVDMLPFLGVMFGPPGTTTASVKPTADAFIANLRTADPAARHARSAATIDSMVDTVAMRPGALDDSIKSDPDVVARAFHELIVTDLGPELGKIAVPTTVLYVMAKTPGMTEAAIDGAYKAAYAPLKGATLKRIPSSAHFIMWDQSEQFQSEVRQFLGQQR
jgi:pimeloyl-ACP methyl ester carboxylesterase